jgi:Family of unknown function (DUF6011)
MTHKRRCRPAGNRADINHDQDVDTPSVTRCRRCKRPLSAPLSLLLRAGPVCRRRIVQGELCNALHSFADDLAVAS